MKAASPFLQRALQLVSKGYHVFPLRAGTKNGQLTTSWKREATNDPAQVTERWTTWPDANIGIHCGGSGILVIDLDLPHGTSTANGRASWGILAEEQGWPTAETARSGRGGGHIYFRNPAGFTNRRGNLPLGVDVRGDGGYVLAPGSVVNGNEYEGDLPAVSDLPSTPASLNAFIRGEVAGSTSALALAPVALSGRGASLAQLLMSPPAEGGRNDWLASACGHLAKLFATDHTTYLLFADLTLKAIPDPTPADEFRKTRDSIWKTEQAKRAEVSYVAETGELDEAKVEAELVRLMVMAEAKRRFDESRRDTNQQREAQPGGQFIFGSTEADDEPVWGNGSMVLWPSGEALMLAGPVGVGKTTLAGQIVRARLGLGSGEVLGFTVKPTSSRVLYLAMDRPRQIGRALRRHFDQSEIGVLNERLVVRPGPPPRDVAAYPEVLAEAAQAVGADTIIIDSLKDAALGLSKDDIGAAYNRARQMCIAAGIEVLELHHMVKRGDNGAKPNTLNDVYGSMHLTGGAGSVVVLWGESGNPLVEFLHLKPSMEVVGPFKVQHDLVQGVSTRVTGADPLTILGLNGSLGMTTKEFCERWQPDREADRAAKLEAERKFLNPLVGRGQVTVAVEKRGKTDAKVWRPAGPDTYQDTFEGGI